MAYVIHGHESLPRYAKEHKFTWDIFLSIGEIVGILIAYFVYNNFYAKDVFALIIVIFMAFQVICAYLLQKIEIKLKNK